MTVRRARLGLGTAQLGLHYGIANRSGRPDHEAAAALITSAIANGVQLIDTAPAYGDAEVLLGELLPPAAATPVAIVTKTVPARTRGAWTEGLQASLQRLRRPAVAGLLVHEPAALLGPDGDALWAELTALQHAGLARRIGVSVYHPHEVTALLARYPLGLVQLPLNVLDQRALHSGAIAALVDAGVEVHARSALLQGLLLLDEHEVPAGLACARAPLRRFQARVRALALTPLRAALGFAANVPGVAFVVCGAERSAQLDELAAASSTTVAIGAFTDLASDDPALVDPSRWRAG